MHSHSACILRSLFLPRNVLPFILSLIVSHNKTSFLSTWPTSPQPHQSTVSDTHQIWCYIVQGLSPKCLLHWQQSPKKREVFPSHENQPRHKSSNYINENQNTITSTTTITHHHRTTATPLFFLFSGQMTMLITVQSQRKLLVTADAESVTSLLDIQPTTSGQLKYYNVTEAKVNK